MSIFYAIFKRAVSLVVDLLAAVLLLPVLMVIIIRFRVRKKRDTGPINIFRLHEGGDLQSIYKKYKSLDPFFTLSANGLEGIYIGASIGTHNDFLLELRKDFYLVESKFIRLLPVSSFLYCLINNSRVIYRYDVSVVHSSGPYFVGAIGYLLSRISRLPFCVSVHADYEKREALQGDVIPRIFGSLRISRFIEKFVYRHADLVLPIRESIKTHILETGCQENKIRIFPHGIDLAAFYRAGHGGNEILRRLGVDGSKKVLSMACRFEKENYIYDHIEMARELSARRKDWVMIMAGDGTERHNLTDLINELKLGDYIKLPGALSHEEIIELRKNSYANICLMGGFSLIEACAASRPVISYDVEWHYELVRDAVTGYLVKEGEISKLVDKIIYLFDNPDIAARLGEAASNLVRERHGLEKTALVKKEIYKELLKRRRIS